MGHYSQILQISVRCLMEVFTDNNPLTYVLTITKWDATSHRWVAALSNYTCSIIYKPSKNNQDVDALSTIQWSEKIKMKFQLELSLGKSKHLMAMLKFFATVPEVKIICSEIMSNLARLQLTRAKPDTRSHPKANSRSNS